MTSTRSLYINNEPPGDGPAEFLRERIAELSERLKRGIPPGPWYVSVSSLPAFPGRCAAEVYRPNKPSGQCQRSARYRHEGKGWCHNHHPAPDDVIARAESVRCVAQEVLDALADIGNLVAAVDEIKESLSYQQAYRAARELGWRPKP